MATESEITIAELELAVAPAAAKWETLGRKLGIQDWRLQVIAADHPLGEGATMRRLNSVMRTWCNTAPDGTWGDVVRALKATGENGLALEIQGKHCSSPEGKMAAELTQEDVGKILKKGDVPPQKAIHVERKEPTEKIRKALYQLKNKDGWVVIHAMGGFGKSVLAAESVRDAKLLQDVFPGGVFWLTVGQESSSEKLLMKMRCLLLMMGEHEYQPPSLEEASVYLQNLKHPRYLLILDDIWNSSDAEKFSFSVCTMITSRNQAIASTVRTACVHHISISEGISDEEGRELLGQWLRKDPKSLSSHADTILKHCRGSPFAIALIGGVLCKNSREARLKAIAEKLQQKHIGAISSRSPSLNYQYRTVNASIELSVMDLPEDLKKCFDMFVVFDYSTMISSEVLATLWEVDSLDAEGYMEELAEYSLVREGSPGSQHSGYLHYFVHDLIMEYLYNTIPKSQQVELHKKVVQCYSDKCDGNFSDLPADGYVHHNLIRHMAIAGEGELLGCLLSSLDWLIASVQHSDPHTLLGSIRMHRNSVPEQFVSGVEQFENFVCNHMHNLTSVSVTRSADIVQLALLQPDISEVYRQAAEAAHADPSKPWFKWCNKVNYLESESVLKLKMHHEWVRHCQYSQDGSRVISCSYDGTVKLWDSFTGRVLEESESQETNLVTSCALSRSGKLIVSSFANHTVEVLDINKKQVLVNFTQHSECVACCDFSPDEKLVVSAAHDSCIMVWEAQTGEVQAKWNFSTDASTHSKVRCCAFSPSGEHIVTGSSSGAIKLWTVMGEMVTEYSGSSDWVLCVAFNSDGKLMSSACLDHRAKIWDVCKGDCIRTLEHSCEVNSCDFSPDSSKLITGDSDGWVKIWSVKDGVMLWELKAYSSQVTCVLYAPSDQHILVADGSGLIRIMKSGCSKEQQSSSGTYATIFSVWFEQVGTAYEAVTVCNNLKEETLEVVRYSDTETVVARLPTVEGHHPISWQISNSGTSVIVGCSNGSVQMFSLLHNDKNEWEAKEVWRKTGSQYGWGIISKCYFSPDDSKIIYYSSKYKQSKVQRSLAISIIAACSQVISQSLKPISSVTAFSKYSLIQSWVTRSSVSGKSLAFFRSSTEYEITSFWTCVCAFFKDNIKVASAQTMGVVIWSCETGVEEQSLLCEDIDDNDFVACIDLSQDNSRLVAVTVQGLVMVWDTEKGAVLLRQDYKEKLSPICSLTPHGSFAAFAHRNLHIWKISRHEPVKLSNKITGTSKCISDLMYSPGTQEFITLCYDRIDWWKVGGSHTKTLFLKTECEHVLFSPDFRAFVTIDNAGRMYIFTSYDYDTLM